MSVNLVEVIEVLDQADALTVKRTQLLDAVRRLDTSHCLEDLSAAVDLHLARPSSCSLETVEARTSSFDFGWARPRDQEEWRVKRETGHRAWLGKMSNDQDVSSVALVVGFFLVGLPLGLLAGLWATQYVGSMGLLFGCIPGVVFGRIGVDFVDVYIDHCASRREKYAPCVLEEGELDTYLSWPACRNYLQAIKKSGVSQVLNGDQDVLKKMSEEQVTLKAQSEQVAQFQARLAAQDERLAQLG